MKLILIFLTGIIIGFVVAWVLFKNHKNQTKLVKNQQSKKDENMERLLEYLNGKTRISNDEVEKFLGVSHTTSFRYLEELENEGKLKQVGNTGSGVYYEKL